MQSAQQQSSEAERQLDYNKDTTSTDSTGTDTVGWGPLSALPGNPLMWVLILSEMLVFAAFFAIFSWERAAQPVLFDASQRQLDPIIGGINTLILLTSGLCAALAVEAIARDQRRRCRQWLLGSLLLGLLFCGVKLYEYSAKLSAGLTPDSNAFFSWYYLLTGFHFAHVLFGLLLLGLVSWRCTRANVETTTAFWHMVDLIWVLLYPLIYLMR